MRKTKQAVALLKSVHAYDDITKVELSRRIRAGKGKARNRKYVQRKGPLLIHSGDASGMVKAFRNILGIECCDVDKLNLLQLAPGGHLGRFIIWTKSAFERLDKVFGTSTTPSESKKNYT